MVNVTETDKRCPTCRHQGTRLAHDTDTNFFAVQCRADMSHIYFPRPVAERDTAWYLSFLEDTRP